jgi:competence protein ComEA
MAGLFPVGKRSARNPGSGQNLFLALLVLVLLVLSWVRTHSGFSPWHGQVETDPSVLERFIVEVEGGPSFSGIYSYPARVEIETVLHAAGVAGKSIPKETLPKHLNTGTKIVLSRSNQGLHLQIRSMDAVKKILYGIPVDVNEIQTDELTLIPGVGPTLSKRITAYREQVGRLTRLDELLHVPGIGRKKLQTLERYLTVEPVLSPNP